MLAQSPSTVPDADLGDARADRAAQARAVPPAPFAAARHRRVARDRVARLSSSVRDLHPDLRALELHQQRARRSLEPGLLEGGEPPARFRPRRQRHAPEPRQGRPQLDAGGARRGRLRVRRRRRARLDRRLLPAAAPTAPSSTVFNVLLSIPQFVLALSLVTVFATTAIDKTGNQHPPSATHRLLRADLRARHRVGADPRAHHPRELAPVVAAGVRARPRGPRARATSAHHVARGAAERAAGHVLDRAPRDRRGDRRRGRALDPGCRGASARGVVGQHDRDLARPTSRPCRTSCSSRFCASSSRCSRSTTSVTSCGHASTCGRAPYEPAPPQEAPGAVRRRAARRSAARGQRRADLLQDAARARARGRRCVPHPRARQDARHRGRVGLREVGALALDHGAAAEQRRAPRQHQVRRSRDRAGEQRRDAPATGARRCRWCSRIR